MADVSAGRVSCVLVNVFEGVLVNVFVGVGVIPIVFVGVGVIGKHTEPQVVPPSIISGNGVTAPDILEIVFGMAQITL